MTSRNLWTVSLVRPRAGQLHPLLAAIVDDTWSSRGWHARPAVSETQRLPDLVPGHALQLRHAQCQVDAAVSGFPIPVFCHLTAPSLAEACPSTLQRVLSRTSLNGLCRSEWALVLSFVPQAARPCKRAPLLTSPSAILPSPKLPWLEHPIQQQGCQAGFQGFASFVR